jgi:hypothetical protein
VINFKINPFVKTFLLTQHFEGGSRKRVRLNRADRKKFYKKKKDRKYGTGKTVSLDDFLKKVNISDGSDIKCEKCVCQSKKIV